MSVRLLIVLFIAGGSGICSDILGATSRVGFGRLLAVEEKLGDGAVGGVGESARELGGGLRALAGTEGVHVVMKESKAGLAEYCVLEILVAYAALALLLRETGGAAGGESFDEKLGGVLEGLGSISVDVADLAVKLRDALHTRERDGGPAGVTRRRAILAIVVLLLLVLLRGTVVRLAGMLLERAPLLTCAPSHLCYRA
jgi:hypothetical protein